MQAKHQTLQTWTQALASAEPVPGGGGAAALLGALAAALASMVGRLTEGKKGYERFGEECTALNAELGKALPELLGLIDEDARVFLDLMNAWKTGATDEDYKAACEASVKTISAVERIVAILKRLLEEGNRNVISDVGIAAHCAAAALESCRLNILVNIRYIKKSANRQPYEHLVHQRVPKILKQASGIARRVEEVICDYE